MPRLSRSGRLFPLVASILLVAGCQEPSGPKPTDPAPLSTQLPPKHTQVQLVSLDHDIAFSRGAEELSAAQTVGLANFLGTNGIRAGDSVTVAASAGASERRAVVLAALRQYRIAAVSQTDANLPSGVVHIHVDHTVVTVPNCPDWSKPETDEPDNRTSSNLGCATEANLAAMVANPTDLVRPDADGKGDGGELTHGVELYRSGNLSKASSSSSSGGSSSGLSGLSGLGSGGGGGGGGSSGGSGSGQ
jgi:pilus assembly protein CpaD